jgi:mRNA interferase RelE/StbE
MMPKYKILFDKKYIKELTRIPKHIQESIREKVVALADNPRPDGSIKLQGSKKTPLYRIRCGDYRVIYVIKDDVLVVLIIDVGHRRDIYL